MRPITIFNIIAVIAILAAFLIFNADTTVKEDTPEDALPQAGKLITAEGNVAEVDRDQMLADGPGLVTIVDAAGARHVVAVPSMGRALCPSGGSITDAYAIEEGDEASVAGILNEEGYIVPCEGMDHYLRVRSTHTEPELLFSFDYEKGPEGYVLTEQESIGDEDPFVTMITLTPTEELEAIEGTDIVREGPPVIQIRAYENTKKRSAFVWVDENPASSGKDRIISPVAEAVVGGANAARYTADGLYAAETFVVANGDHVYVLTGMYIDRESKIFADFLTLIDSFTFLPPQSV